MAIRFELWAECGTEEDCAVLVQHFTGLQSVLLTGRKISWNVSTKPSLPTGISVWSAELGRTTLLDALETTEAGLHLYHHLKIGPAFRFARAAWEASLVSISSLGRYVEPILESVRHLTLQCALDDDLFREIGSPKFCGRFRDEYWWTGYSGETYQPLWSDDQEGLNRLYESLFPDCCKR